MEDITTPVQKPPPQPGNQPNKKRLNLSLNLRFLIVLLLIAMAGMLVTWKPWQANIKASDRTITVTGEATLSSTPDEYVFSPSYDFTNTDKKAALEQLSKKSDEIVAKLKSLGVVDSAIKTNSSNYSNGIYSPVPDNEGNPDTYTLNLTVTVADKTLAQKVQDYLVATIPKGAVSPQADFSDTKRKKLESQARDQATKDARAKADQSAKNLGFKIAGVKSVTDGSGFGIPISLMQGGAAPSAKDQAVSSSLGVQPGENKLTYSVTVIYYIN